MVRKFLAVVVVLLLHLIQPKILAFQASRSSCSHPVLVRPQPAASRLWRERRDYQYYDDANDDVGFSTRRPGKSVRDPSFDAFDLNDRRESPIERYDPYGSYPPADLDRYYDSDDRVEQYEDDEDWLEDDYDDDYDDNDTSGNFWSNPTNRVDADAAERRRGYSPMPQARRRSAGDRRRRTSIRSTNPDPPGIVRDFYNRFFWYGFDPDDSADVGDKTIFGGTKGKFNGLSYLYYGEGRSNQRPQERKPRRTQRRPSDDYYDVYENDSVEYDELEEPKYRVARSSDKRQKPPADSPYPLTDKNSQNDETRPPRRVKERLSNSDYRYDDSGPSKSYTEDWDEYDAGTESDFRRSRESASPLFGNWDVDDEFDGRRRQSRKSRDWFPFSVADAFFRIDRDSMDSKAREYSERMGTGRKTTRLSDSQSRPRRAGYAYRVEDGDIDEEDEYSILDVDSDDADVGAGAGAVNAKEAARDMGTESESSREDIVDADRSELSWEKRAVRMEQVPPADVPAWGPTGDLGMSAREKAFIDAMEDIADAKRRLAAKVKKEELAREDIRVLRVDAELQRRRLSERRQYSRESRGRLRQIEREIDQASLQLRRATAQVNLARKHLEELEDRHWALFSCFDVDKASDAIGEALRELDEQFSLDPSSFPERSSSERKSGDPNSTRIAEPTDHSAGGDDQ